jgi:hypothetical protein
MQRRGIFPKRCDVVFVTAQGVIRAEEKVPPSDAPLTPQLARSLHERNLETLRNILNSKKYDEIYVNLGHNYLQSIEGFEKSTNAKITHATGVLGRVAFATYSSALSLFTRGLPRPPNPIHVDTQNHALCNIPGHLVRAPEFEPSWEEGSRSGFVCVGLLVRAS